MLSFQRLDVYRRAIEFLALVGDIVDELPKGHSARPDQLVRAAESVVRNIAERAGRWAEADSCRTRLWKVELQKFVDDTGLRVTVAHYPPGTSKWNKIEHRMFSFITQNWRGRALLSVQTVVSLIANTTTATGLKIKAALDTRAYDTAVDVADEEFAAIKLRPSRFHGDWNYAIG